MREGGRERGREGGNEGRRVGGREGGREGEERGREERREKIETKCLTIEIKQLLLWNPNNRHLLGGCSVWISTQLHSSKGVKVTMSLRLAEMTISLGLGLYLVAK